MISLTFVVFIQVWDSGPQGPLVLSRNYSLALKKWGFTGFGSSVIQ